jgi:glycosyltransferase involved in cell wall biosynthesis
MPSESETGLTYHRQLVPHNDLSKDTEYTVSRVNNINALTGEQLKDFQIVHFLREIDTAWKGGSKYTIERLKKLGIKVVFDIDDYWVVPKTHSYYPKFKRLDIGAQYEEILKLVDCVTTTTEHLASKIKPFNKNVCVLPNAIDTEDSQWQPRTIENNRLRFGWIGGVHHREDIKSIAYSVNKMFAQKALRDKFQFCLGGFNVTTHFSNEDEKLLKQLGCDTDLLGKMSFVEMVKYLTSKRINAPVPEYTILERMVTDDYKSLKWDVDYFKYLQQFTPAAEHIANDKEYKRLWGKDVFSYGTLYNEIDVALVPLIPNEFSACKSQLKIIEAGVMGKAVIVSDVLPYTVDCLHEDNCLMVKPSYNQLGWFEAMKRYMESPALREDMAAALHYDVMEKYRIEIVNEQRKELYQNLIK